jgi:hypothetical protein
LDNGCPARLVTTPPAPPPPPTFKPPPPPPPTTRYSIFAGKLPTSVTLKVPELLKT